MPAARPGRSHGLGVGWAGSAEDYIKATRIFKCPEDNNEPIQDPAGATKFPISYAMNQWVAGQPQSVLYGCSTTVLAFECPGLRINMDDHVSQAARITPGRRWRERRENRHS